MLANDFLDMSIPELSRIFIAELLKDLSAAKTIVEDLEAGERFRQDAAFRTIVETGKGVLASLVGDCETIVSICPGLLEQANELELWQMVATNRNLLGNAYFFYGMYEKALENYYGVIQTEERYGLFSMTSIAYNNIAMIYNNFEAPEKVVENMEKAIETLEKGGSDQPRYYPKRVLYLCDLSMAYCRMNRLEEASYRIAQADEIDAELVTEDVIYSKRMAKMYYYFRIGEVDHAKGIFYQAWDMLKEEDSFHKMGLLNEFLEHCYYFELPLAFYKNEIIQIETLHESDASYTNVRAYKNLIKYYKMIGNYQKLELTRVKYIEMVEKDEKNNRNRQLDSLLILDEIVQKRKKIYEIESQNIELKEIAEEAIRNRNSVQTAYQRSEMISKLGRNMISSLNMEKVIEVIYRDLNQYLPVDSFILAAVEPEQQRLRTITRYEDNQLQPEVCIDINNENSMFVRCYQQGEMIASGDLPNDPRFSDVRFIYGEGEQVRTVVFIPLKMEDKIIGVYSIQNYESNCYEKKHLEFLEEFTPYLAIALNNAIYSMNLENEIKSRLEVQAKLEETNFILEQLSSLDGLTEISNRRDFESKMSVLLQNSQESEQPVSVFMFDIDYFKIYNDTYGHLEGDEALKKVAHIVRKNLNKVSGLSARFGGEEFIGACSGLSIEESKKLAEQIRKDVMRLKLENINTQKGILTISIGVCFASQVDIGMRSSMLRVADISLYEAKNTGKNRVVLKEVSKENIDEIE